MFGAAVAFTTLTNTTRAYVTTNDTLVSSGAVSLLATSSHDILTTADGTYTNSALNNGFAIALNATFLRDEAFVGGTPTIDAPTLNIATGGGSALSALARSGEAGLGGANPQTEAASLVLSTGFNLSHAYIDAGTTLTLLGGTDVTISAANTTVINLSAEPQGVVGPADLGLGRSVALNTSGYTTQASILAGASVLNAGNLSLLADGDQTSLVTAYAGTLADDFGVITDLNQITIAGSMAINTTTVLVEAGASLVLSGALNVQSNHRASNILRARSDAAAVIGEVPGSAIATPIAINLAADTATATVAGVVDAGGAVDISADADVENQAESIAGVQGTLEGDTSVDTLVANEIAFLSDRSNLAFGTSAVPPNTDPGTGASEAVGLGANLTQGQAAALAANLSQTIISASITDTATVTATNSPLQVSATSDVDSIALASAGAAENVLGIAAALAVNVQSSETTASIGGVVTADHIQVSSGLSGDLMHEIEASAISGVGLSEAGVSGAVAVTQALGSSQAAVDDGAELTLTNVGDLLVDADAHLVNTSNAVPVLDMGLTLGVGASIELNSSIFRTSATIGNAEITGADDVSVLANGQYIALADSSAGGEAGSTIGAAIAGMISDNRTIASLSSNTTLSTITGDLLVSAQQDSTA
ncbi:MAG: hypothetical protein OER92_10005, partial [Alphaproteobacteria bacterium]|nr:hypothetical protein [Alphaproteobacteria bacterium]